MTTTTRVVEIDLADGCLSGIDNAVERISEAVTNYANMESAATYDRGCLSDKYRVTIAVELLEPFSAGMSK